MLQFDPNKYYTNYHGYGQGPLYASTTASLLLLYGYALYDKRAFVRSDAVIHDLYFCSTGHLKYDGNTILTYDGITPEISSRYIKKLDTFNPYTAPRATQKDIEKINARRALLGRIHATAVVLNDSLSRNINEFRYVEANISRTTLNGRSCLQFKVYVEACGGLKYGDAYNFETYYFID